LNKKEIRRLISDVQNPGYTIIPLKMFIMKGKIKVEIGLCKGKKDYDKRESIKERDSKRELDRIKKNF
jgi:SsrA-binding protein